MDPLGTKLCLINSNKLLKVNYTAPSLQEYYEKAKDNTGLQSFKNGLLKHQEQLIVVKEQNLQTQLIAEVYT